MANPVFPPGPRLNALYSVGTELLDLSVADKTWNPDTVPSPISVRCDAATELHYRGYNGVEDTQTLAAGETFNVAVVTVFMDSDPNTGIHVYY